MAAIPQISTGGIGRGSSDTNNLGAKKRDAGLEQRDIIGLERGEYARPPIRNKTNGADIGEGDKRREFLPMTVRLAKNPVLAVESLRQFVNNELISIAKLNGYTDLYNELETLNKTLYLPPEDIVGEILYQEKNNTTFADEALFDLLRPLAKAADSLNNDNMKDTLGLFLRSVNFVQNNDEVLKSVASNLRFLSGYFKPRPDLSENLAELSKQWDSQNAEGNFRLLRTETLALLENVNRSLIANDRTQILIPLIVHNISRYNTNASMITDSFANLLSFVPGEAKRKELIDAFTEFATKMFPEGIPKDDTPYIPSKRRLFGSGNNVAKELLNAKLGTAEQSGKAGQTGQSQNAQNTRETRQGNVNNNVNNNEIIRTVDNGGNIRYTDQDGNDLERFTDDKGNIRFADKNGNVLDNTGNRVDENGNRIDNNGNRVDNNGNPILPPEPRTGAPRLIGVYLSVPHVAEEVRESGLNFAEPAEILSGEIAVAKTSPPEEEVLRRAFAAVTETLEPLLPNEFPERIPESIMRELDKFAPNRQSELPQKLLQQMPQELAETPKTPNALLRAELTVIKNSQTPIAEMVNYMNDTLKFMPDIPARLSVYDALVSIVHTIEENAPNLLDAESEIQEQQRQALQAQNQQSASNGQNVQNNNNQPNVPQNSNPQFNPNTALPTDKANTNLPQNNNPLYGSEGAIQNAAELLKSYQNGDKTSVIERLVGFVGRNIDHSAMKTVHNYNTGNLLQSMINAPGVFTPLAHYIIPIQANNTRAFGELWVGDVKEGGTGRDYSPPGHHLFLTFDIDTLGRFEIDLYTRDKDTDLMFFYPESFSDRAGVLMDKAERFIAREGYTPKTVRSSVLKKPHDLIQVFPEILNGRKGFDTTI